MPSHPIAARTEQCERCGKQFPHGTSAWDLCLECLDAELAKMDPKELADVPGAVLELFNLKPEYFRD